MHIEQLYTKCLAQGAYFISSDGEAAIIDPLREIEPYLNLLNKNKVKLKYIFETHFHADFVSGHLDLSKKTGAQIIYGPTAHPAFDCYIAADNEFFSIGKLKLKVLHTPGHTMESVCYLLFDESGHEVCLFSGDTLFLGDVGRPDLAQAGSGYSQEQLAGILYDSIYQKLLPLPDHILIYPAHGAGSSCGKNMMQETVDTLKHQKEVNYALNQKSKSDFIREVLDGLGSPPPYFEMNVALNKNGYEAYDELHRKKMKALDIIEFSELQNHNDVIILDTRSADEFCKGFILGSINIGLDGQFAPWVGSILANVTQKIILITSNGREEESILRLARVGFDQVLGYLKGGFQTWKDAGHSIETIHRINASSFEREYNQEDSKIIDIRKESEYNKSHVVHADFKTLDEIPQWLDTLNDSQHQYIYCGGGYRSMIAASMMKAKGLHNFTEIEGGFGAIAKTNIPISYIA
ncbi:MAG TPA: MBL fold metallo-hydrolase [Saprospiraceae bacterium]|nr:MBL fold metallo-hydrolase [Saprospiraceae bacterium]